MHKISINSLDDVRDYLTLLEDPILVYAFMRLHYKSNDVVYQPGGIPIKGFKGSCFEYALRENQISDARMGRFNYAGEIPFIEMELPEPVMERDRTYFPLGDSKINVNGKILDLHEKKILTLCEKGDDGHYGFTSKADAGEVNFTSSRVHNGIYVADFKYMKDPELFRSLAKRNDREGILENVFVAPKENEILARIGPKAGRYGMDIERIVDFYRNGIMKLTKDVEVDRVIEVWQNEEAGILHI